MEERRERVIRLSSDSTSFLQNCMVDYSGEHWCEPMILGETCEIFRSLSRFFTVFHRKSRVVTSAAVGYERLNYATVKLVTFEERAVAAETFLHGCNMLCK